MTVAYYISAHGFGHFVRAAQVIKELVARGERVLVRSAIPEWFVRQELGEAPVEVIPGQFDVGAVGPDSITIDAAESFRQAIEVHEAALEKIGEEAELLRSRGAKIVVCDAPAAPVLAAIEAGLPSIVIANFTWVEIYEHLLTDSALPEAVRRMGRDAVARYREAYDRADLLLRPGLDLQMPRARRQVDVPVISRNGRPRRELLARLLDFDPARPIYQVYLGGAGYAGMDWADWNARLRGEQLFSFTPMQGDTENLIRVLTSEKIAHADATASIDAVIGKLGYSLCAECLAAAKPIVYPPRPDFAEMTALERGMREANLAIALSPEAFRRADFADALAEAARRAPTLRPVTCNGAEICADWIQKIADSKNGSG